LTQHHQLTDLYGGGRWDDTAGILQRLDGGQMVGRRADATNPRHEHRYLLRGHALDEQLEPAQLRSLKVRREHLAPAKVDHRAGMPLDSAERHSQCSHQNTLLLSRGVPV